MHKVTRLTAGIVAWLLCCGIAGAQTADQWMQRADQLERQGIALIQSGNVNAGDVEVLWGEALAIYRGLGQVGHEARLLGNLGQFHLKLENPRAAAGYLEDAAALAASHDQPAAEADYLLKLGRAYRGAGDTGAAQETLQRALQLGTMLEDAAAAGEAAGNLGQLAAERGDTEATRRYFGLAREWAERGGLPGLAISAVGSEGDFLYERQLFADAIERYSEALDIARQVEDREAQLKLLLSIGNAYYFLGNCEYAAAFHDWGAGVARESRRDAELGEYLGNRGNAEYCLGRFEDAEASYAESLRLATQLGDHDRVARLNGNLGLVAIQLGRFGEAISQLERDLAQSPPGSPARAVTLGALGDAYYFQADYEQALGHYDLSLAAARQAGYRRGEALMLTNVGAARLRLGAPAQAEAALREGLALLRSMRATAGEEMSHQVSLFERESRANRLLQRVLMDSGEAESALVVAESGRAQVLSRMFRGEGEGPGADDVLADIRRTAARGNYTIVVYSLIHDLPRFREDETWLYIWTIGPDGAIDREKVALSAGGFDLPALVREARSGMGITPRGAIPVRSEPGPDSSRSVLYRLLIEPVEPYLSRHPDSTIAFIPQDALFMLPFAALEDGSGQPLVARFPIVHAPAVQLLEPERPISDWSRALVMGNPGMPSIRHDLRSAPIPLDPLPGAEAEARAVAELLRTRPVTGQAATRELVEGRMANASSIHLATHGLLDVGPDGLLNANRLGYGLASGTLALTPTEQDGGLLPAEDVASMRLEAEIVVLSACHSGEGRITGDGVLGLSRAFRLAGVRTAVVSLWQVADESTAELMIRFYTYLLDGAVPSHALRKAMLDTREHYAQAIHWAAFIVIT